MSDDERVVPEAEAALSRFLICGETIPDVEGIRALAGECSRCKAPIAFSSAAPRELPRICLKCAEGLGLGVKRPDGGFDVDSGVHLVTTEKLAQEFQAAMERKFGKGGKA